MDSDRFLWISVDFYGFLWICDVLGPECWSPVGIVAACAGLKTLVNPCGSRLDLPNIKISDSGGLDLEAWYLDARMLAGLEWIGGGRKKFPHARASGGFL